MAGEARGTREALTQRASGRSARAPRSASERQAELAEANERLDVARKRFLTAAIAFCDGSISVGQLRAVRELLREQEVRVGQLQGAGAAPFVQEPPPGPQAEGVEAITPEDSRPAPPAEAPAPQEELADDLKEMLASLEHKLARLEQDFQQGRVNASQYRAIRRHYLEQRDVATRLRRSYPESDRWRVVLEEGKTTFLLQLNEAVCHALALYDVHDRTRIFVQGRLPPAAEEAVALLRTFGPSGADAASGRMLATQAEDGSSLLLIPGEFTAALVVFSQQPPGWQVRALREVHRNFEAANHVPLSRSEHHGLIFPDLTRFIRPGA